MTLAPAATDAPERSSSAALFRFAVISAALTLVHIKGGAMVVSTGSGMAFTTWPLSRGSWWPEGMEPAEYFEHLHRVGGALVGLLGLVLAVWVHRVDPRSWLRNLCWASVGLLVFQGLLGKFVVEMGEKDGLTWAPAAILHAVFGQATLAVQVVIAFALSRGFAERLRVPAPQVARARKLATIALVCVVAQLVFGAVFRHTNATGVLWIHVFWALVVSVAVLIASAYAGSRFGGASAGFRRTAMWVNGILLLQLTLGFVTLAVRRFKDPSNIEYIGMSLIVSSHVVVGACLFLVATLLVAKSRRNLVPDGTLLSPGVAR